MSPLLRHSNTNQYNINNGLLCTCFTKDPETVHYFPGGGGGGWGVQLFSRGVQMIISIETHIRTCYFPGGVSGPPIPLWIHTWAMSS